MSGPSRSQTAAPRRDTRVRRFGTVLFPLVLAEGAIGVASAGAGLSGVTDLLVLHVAFGAVLVAVMVGAVRAAMRVRSRGARTATGFTAVALGGTAGTGALFLVTSFGGGASVDRLLAALTLMGTVLMIVFGSAVVPEGS